MTASQSRWGGQSTVGNRWSYEDTKDNGRLSAAGGLGVLGGGAAAAYGGLRVASGHRAIGGIESRFGEIGRLEEAGRIASGKSRAASKLVRQAEDATTPRDADARAAHNKDLKSRKNALNAARADEARYYGKWDKKNKGWGGGGLIDQAKGSYQDAELRRPAHLKAIKTGRRFMAGGALLGVGGIGAAVAADNLRRVRAKPLQGGTAEFEAVMRRRKRG